MKKLISTSGDYFAISTYDVYGMDFTGKEKWIIVSNLSTEILLQKYPETMRTFAPFIFLTDTQWQVFENDYRLEDKFRKQFKRHEAKLSFDGYDDDVLIDGRSAEQAVARFEDMMDIVCLRSAWQQLTRTQRRRMRMYYFEGLTLSRIADSEGVGYKTIWESISASKKKIKDFLDQDPIIRPTSVLTDRRTKKEV